MSEKSMSKDTRKNVILLHHLFVVTFTGNIAGV